MLWTIMNPFKSLEIDVGFEDRVYGLGEVIEIRITLAAKRRVNIRGLHAELICEERWSHVEFVNERPASERSTPSSEFIGYMVDRVRDAPGLYDDAGDTKPSHGRWTEVDSGSGRQQRYVLETTHFGRDTKVEAGTTTLNAKIRIPAASPPHASKAQVKWILRVSVDVAWGPDAKAHRAVRVIY